MTDLTILGLCIRWATMEHSATLAMGGPAVYAALGARLAGTNPILQLRLGCDVSPREIEFIRSISRPSSTMERVDQRNLLWEGPTRVALSGPGKVRGEPSSLSPVLVPDSSGVLAIANMDPGAVTAAALVWPRLVLVDLYESWIRYRPKSSIELARRADVLFLTEQELAAFSPSSQRDIVDAPDKFIVLKRGPQGVTLRYGGQHRQLPAASPERVLSDLGAGDLVLGFVAARLASRVKDDKRIDINDLESAYLEALPWIAQLLESPSPIDFLARQERLQ